MYLYIFISYLSVNFVNIFFGKVFWAEITREPLTYVHILNKASFWAEITCCAIHSARQQLPWSNHRGTEIVIMVCGQHPKKIHGHQHCPSALSSASAPGAPSSSPPPNTKQEHHADISHHIVGAIEIVDGHLFGGHDPKEGQSHLNDWFLCLVNSKGAPPLTGFFTDWESWTLPLWISSSSSHHRDHGCDR